MTPLACLLVAAGLSAAGAGVVAAVDDAALPAALRVPAGHELRLWSVGKGEVRYACRRQAGAGGGYAWVAGLSAGRLYDVYRREIGWSYGGPTWKSVDGSSVTGQPLASAPAGEGHLPLQLLRVRRTSGRPVVFASGRGCAMIAIAERRACFNEKGEHVWLLSSALRNSRRIMRALRA